MTDENRKRNARDEAAIGEEALRAARVLLDARLPNDALSRAYYAMFHLARAVLFLDGLQPRTHKGVVAVLLDSRTPARLPREAIDDLSRLQSLRDVADYSQTRLTDEKAASEVATAERFVAAARAVLAASGA